jgi:SlyX protein
MAADVDLLQQQMMELQSQLAFQEDAVRSLDEALAHQQRDLILLRQQLELLRQRQDQQQHAVHIEAGLASVPLDEKPPHY